VDDAAWRGQAKDLGVEGEGKGPSVQSKTDTGLVVREFGGGTSSVSFSYRIVARRRSRLAWPPHVAARTGPR